MGAVAVFDLASWRLAFPAFSNVSDVQITTVPGGVLWYAEQLVRNDGGSPVCNQDLQTALLNLMVAHLCYLWYGTAAQATAAGGGSGPMPVGRMSDATEGSVTARFEYAEATQNSAWFNQSPYGAMYWQMMLPYRLGKYVPKVTPLAQPFPNMGLGLPWRGYR